MQEETKVYRLGAGCSLIPVSFEGVEIGMRVRYASDFGVYTVIGREMSGWTIANGKGETHSGQQTESLSPYTRIEVLKDLRVATTEEIEGLNEAVAAKKQEDEMASRAAAAQKQSDYVGILGELKKNYPNAAVKGSDYARAAKNLKAELKKAFPLVDFSVKSESYSGGCAVRIEWTNGATTAQVEAYSNKYQYGNFDGMEDIYNYDGSAYSKAVQEYLGSAKYVSTTRNFSDDVKSKVRAAIQSGYGETINSYDLDIKVYGALQDAEIYGAFLGVELEAGRDVARFAPATSPTSPTGEVETAVIAEFSTGEFTHTTKKTQCFVATLTNRIAKDDFKDILRAATSAGGYYSKFNKEGAIAGFIFTTAEKREAFLERFK